MSIKTYEEIANSSIKWGFIGSLSLLLVYFGILSLANSIEHALQQFSSMWYWVSLLAAGFGIQIGLYSLIRQSIKQQLRGITAEVAASGGVSTGSMIACCAHHLSDVLPIIGLSAAAIFLNKYQLLFIVVGVLSNLIGINIMLKIIQKHKLNVEKGKFLSKLLRIDMKKAMNYTILLSLIIFVITLFLSLR